MPAPRDYQRKGAIFAFRGMTRSKDQPVIVEEIAPGFQIAAGKNAAAFFASIGAGKTCMSLMALDELIKGGFTRSCLVLAPPRVVYDTWPTEIKKWTPHIGHRIIHGQKSLGAKARIEIQSLDSVHTLVDYAGRWDTLIVDESRNFANWTTRRTRSLRKLLKKIKYRLILTGTPTPEHFGELFAQMFILDGGESLGKNVTIFRANYMEKGGWMGRVWKFRDEKAAELEAATSKYVMRIDATTHPDFPKLTENDIWVPMPPEIKADYNKLKRELALELSKYEHANEQDRANGSPLGTLMVGHAGALYGKLKQLACGQVYIGSLEAGNRQSIIVHNEKIKAMNEILSELYGCGSIIIYHCKHDLTRIVEELKRQKRKVGVLSGATSPKDSVKVIADWNERKLDNVVAHYKCMGEGLNLQFGGCDMLWYALPDGCNPYLQTRGRLWRPGNQEGIARMHRIAMRGTVEELQLERMDGKIKGQNAFLSALKNQLKVS